MNIGVIGTGNIGAVIVKKLRDAGYPVKMATSKGPDSLRELAAKTGAMPVSVEENGTKAYRSVENADYQTQASAFRSLFNEKK